MIKSPKLKSYLTLFPISESIWGVRGGSDELWRLKMGEGAAMRAFSLLLPYLNGTHTSDEIVERMAADGVTSDATRRIIERLETAGLLEDASDGQLSSADQEQFNDQITFFSRFSRQGGQGFQARLREARIGLLDGGRLGQSLLRQLELSGFGQIVLLSEEPEQLRAQLAISRHGGNGNGTQATTTVEVHRLDRDTVWPSAAGDMPQLLLVPQQTHDPSLLEAVDTLSKKHDLPWLMVRYLDFREGWVGPLFVPGDTACYLSLDARLRGNLPFYDEYQAFDQSVRDSGEPPVPPGGLHSFFDLLSSIAVVEVVKLISGIRVPYLGSRFLTINLWTWEVEEHEVLKLPRIDAGLTARPTPFPWKDPGQ